MSLALAHPMPRCRSFCTLGRLRPWLVGGIVVGILLVVLGSQAGLAAEARLDAPRPFDVPAGEAVNTLKLAARQGGLEIVFFAETVRGIRTPAVRGLYLPRDALARLVDNTGLVVVPDEKSGTLSIHPIDYVPLPPAEALPLFSLSP